MRYIYVFVYELISRHRDYIFTWNIHLIWERICVSEKERHTQGKRERERVCEQLLPQYTKLERTES